MDTRNAKDLYNRYINNQCTEEERALVERIFDGIAYPEIQLDIEQIKRIQVQVRQKLLISTAHTSQRRFSLQRRWGWVAAGVLLLIGAATFFLVNRSPDQKIKQSAQVAEDDVQPGGKRATLTLGNGEQIDLTSAKAGKLIEEPGVSVSKSSGDIVEYTKTAATTFTPVFNTISTPRGGQYRVTLPEGTKVWLNAASSITFPTSFDGSPERSVSISGECYFEVAPNKNQPFIVECPGQKIQVLGTHFNVKSYTDEPDVRTTLLEGNVKVITPTSTVLLTPGKQTVNRKGVLSVQKVSTQVAVAWKDGEIAFDDADIYTVFREISRWYDIDVTYEGKMPDDLFKGSGPRTWTLSFILDILKASNIKFEIVKSSARTSLIVKPE